MLFAAYFVITLLALWVLVAIYCLSMAVAGRLAGIEIDECAIGVGFVLCRFSLGGLPITCKMLPLAGYAKFREFKNGEPLLERARAVSGGVRDSPAARPLDENPWRYESAPELLQSDAPHAGSFAAAPYLFRIGILVCGPLASALTGLTLIALPVWMESPDRLVRFGDGKLLDPSGVPDLRLEQTHPTQRTQFTVTEQTVGQFLRRLLFFGPLEGWGGGVACVVTSAAIAAESHWSWVTCVGIIALGQAALNLLPIPVLNGGRIILESYSALFGTLGDRAWTWINIAGLLFIIVLYVRVLWLDVTWIKELF
jgi:membrane-associated protease RseP (regulator of RpoE activity)